MACQVQVSSDSQIQQVLAVHDIRAHLSCNRYVIKLMGTIDQSPYRSRNLCVRLNEVPTTSSSRTAAVREIRKKAAYGSDMANLIWYFFSFYLLGHQDSISFIGY